MHTQSMNAKLNRITQGERMGLDYIEAPKGEWLLLRTSEELFHYNHGVFEAYPRSNDTENVYKKYHVIKVVLDDAVQAVVEEY